MAYLGTLLVDAFNRINVSRRTLKIVLLILKCVIRTSYSQLQILAELHLNAGETVDSTLSDGSPLLMVTIGKNLVEITRMLIEFGSLTAAQSKVQVQGD